jgi:hypothetical protein
MIGKTNVTGGAGLNFKVVGNPQPENPKANTIWVDTDVKITGWDFSAAEPVNPAEGIVWIFTGTSSPVEFNALKKNCIQVYPLSAKQYIGGAWVDKVAKSYQNGAWVDWWNGELYEIGKEYTNLTGGWTNIGYSAASGTTINAGSKTDDGIYLAPPTGEVDLAGTDKTIDLTDATTLYCKIDVKKYGGYPNVFCVSKTKVITSPTAIAETNATGVQTLSIDVTTLTGEYYISMRATTGSQVYFQECRFDQK